MKKIEKILVPVDFSECSANAFRYALQFADKYGAKILLQHIVSQDIALDYPILVAQETTRLLKEARIELNKFVGETLLQVEMDKTLKNVPIIHSDILLGPPLALVVEKAAQEDIDLILMGTQGEHNALDKLFGGMTTYVLKNAHCSVLVVPENATATKILNIGYATDLTAADPFYIWELGKLLSPFHAIFNVCHVHLAEEPTHELDLQEIEKFFGGKSPALQIKFCEDTAETIEDGLNEFAEIYGIDLMVMLSPKRGFFANLMHKSATRKLVFASKVPILVIR